MTRYSPHLVRRIGRVISAPRLKPHNRSILGVSLMWIFRLPLRIQTRLTSPAIRQGKAGWP